MAKERASRRRDSIVMLKGLTKDFGNLISLIVTRKSKNKSGGLSPSLAANAVPATYSSRRYETQISPFLKTVSQGHQQQIYQRVEGRNPHRASLGLMQMSHSSGKLPNMLSEPFSAS